MKTENYQVAKCNTYVYFALKGDDFDPQKVTDRIGILPSRFGSKGKAGKYNSSLPFSSWIISTEIGKEYFDIEKLLEEIIDKLSEKVEVINELKSELNLNSILEVVLDVDANPNESTPSLGFSQKVIRFLYQTNTIVDVDIHSFTSKDGAK